MNEKPILFSTPMVRAILDGRKTMTRRVVKPQPQALIELNGGFHPTDDNGDFMPQSKHYADGKHFLRCVAKDFCPYGQPGDHLWVRETWALSNGIYYYLANRESPIVEKWKPSIFMPRCASRITLEITNVRVERLQDISAPDCVNEGINTQGPYDVAIYDEFSSHSIAQFAYLWDSISSKKYPWASNPWVFAIEFKRVEATNGT